MNKRGQLVLGILLILLGAWFAMRQQLPALPAWATPYMEYPLNIVAAGAGILLLGILLGNPGLAIPAAIVAGVGGILYYQHSYEDYQSWSFMWALIPGFAGVGNVLAGTLSRSRSQVASGLNAMAVSAVLFIIFAALFGRLAILGAYAPALIFVLLGVWLLARGLWRK